MLRGLVLKLHAGLLGDLMAPLLMAVNLDRKHEHLLIIGELSRHRARAVTFSVLCFGVDILD